MNLKKEYTILMVDDSFSDRRTYCRYLLADNHFNYRILEAETLEAGLKLWQAENSQPIDLVLIALRLPDGSGLDWVENIKANYPYPELPIIVIAEQDDKNLIIQSMKLGIRDYLSKGEMTENVLLRSIHSALKELELTQQLAKLKQQEAIFAETALKISQAQNLEAIFQALTTDVQVLLNADRVIIYQFQADFSGTIVAETVLAPWRSCLNDQVVDTCFQENGAELYRQGRFFIASDIYQANLADCHLQLLEQFQVRASLVVPILVLGNEQNTTLWGLLVVHQCSGTRHWEEDSISVLQRLSVKLAIAIQQFQTNQQIVQGEARLKKIIDTVPGMLYTLVRRTDGSYYFDYISPLVEDILEVTAQEAFINPQCIFQQIHPDDIEGYLNKVEESFAKMAPFNCEWRIIAPSGQEKWLKAASSPERQPDGQVIWFGFCFEITDLKTTQQQLQQLNQTLEFKIAERTHELWKINHLQSSILNSTDLGIITTNFEGIIQSFNYGAEKMLGYRAETVIGRRTPDLFLDPAETQKLAEKLSSELGTKVTKELKDLNLKTQYFSQEKEQTCIRQDGSRFPGMLSVRRLENEQQQIIGFLHIYRDMTEHKQSEIELKNAYLELEKLLKLREETLTLREDMSNMIIHDLRNPLTAMMLSAEIILKYGDRAEARSIVTKQANQMLQAGKHITNMIDSLLLMAKLESGKIIFNPTLTDLHGLGSSIVADFQLMATLRNSQLISQLPPPGTHLLIDSIILRRIIENLLSNALKFSPPQSQTYLTMEVLPQDHIRITVADNGPGIDPDSYDKICGKFEIGQVQQNVSQTGLGLAFCKMAIEAQGGTLAIAPNQPQGSIFTVEI